MLKPAVVRGRLMILPQLKSGGEHRTAAKVGFESGRSFRSAGVRYIEFSSF